jgi:hypothetical protein
MQFTTSLLALAALSSSVLAGPHHRHFHVKKSPMPAVFEALTERVSTSSASTSSGGSSNQPAAPAAPAAPATPAAPAAIDVVSKLSQLGSKAAVNSNSNNGGIWIGTDGPYTNEFHNSASEPIVVVVWGSQGSWVNAVAPQVAISLAPGASKTVSFANGQSGAWAGIYSDTALVNGQIANTWGEFTFSNPYSTVDVSREVNMNGRGMSIKTPNCVSDMTTCVFQCTGGAASCQFNYELVNCANGSQGGAQYGTYAGAASGGCGGMGATANLKTTFS